MHGQNHIKPSIKFHRVPFRRRVHGGGVGWGNVLQADRSTGIF